MTSIFGGGFPVVFPSKETDFKSETCHNYRLRRKGKDNNFISLLENHLHTSEFRSWYAKSQGGHSGTEGGRTFVTYFAEEGVFF